MADEKEASEKQQKADERSLPAKILTASLRMPVVLILILIILTFFGTSYFLSRYPNALGFIGITLNPQLAAEQKNVQLLENVGDLMNLPDDELPTIATVTDVEAVFGQPFFKDAKNGDKVLIYTNTGKAILYRPGENKIIEVGAVNINQQNQVEISKEESAETEQDEGEVGLEEAAVNPEEQQTSTPEEQTSEEGI